MGGIQRESLLNLCICTMLIITDKQEIIQLTISFSWRFLSSITALQWSSTNSGVADVLVEVFPSERFFLRNYNKINYTDKKICLYFSFNQF